MSLADEIKKLEDLRRDRVLTEDEFTRAKDKLLNPSGLGNSMQRAIDDPDDRTWGLVIHLSLLLGFTVVGIAVPIVIWQVMKQKSAVMDAHGINVMNWMLSLAIYLIAFGILSLIFIGIPLLIVVAILTVVFPIIGAIKAQNGEVWRYPLSISFISQQQLR